MSTELVNALWVGSHIAELPDRTVLIPGETKLRIPRAEAERSGNWLIDEPAKTKKGDD